MDLHYEHSPKCCHHCSVAGHLVTDCRKARRMQDASGDDPQGKALVPLNGRAPRSKFFKFTVMWRLLRSGRLENSIWMVVLLKLSALSPLGYSRLPSLIILWILGLPIMLCLLPLLIM